MKHNSAHSPRCLGSRRRPDRLAAIPHSGTTRRRFPFALFFPRPDPPSSANAAAIKSTTPLSIEPNQVHPITANK